MIVFYKSIPNNLEKTDPSEIERTYNIRKKNVLGFIESVHEK